MGNGGYKRIQLLFIYPSDIDVIILTCKNYNDIFIGILFTVTCNQKIVIVHPILQNPAMYFERSGLVQTLLHLLKRQHIPDRSTFFRMNILCNKQFKNIIVIHVIIQTGIAVSKQILRTKYRNLPGLYVHTEHCRIFERKQINRTQQTQRTFPCGNGTGQPFTLSHGTKYESVSSGAISKNRFHCVNRFIDVTNRVKIRLRSVNSLFFITLSHAYITCQSKGDAYQHIANTLIFHL